MKLKFSKPAPGERYLISQKDVKGIVRAVVPELGTLSFATRHGPKMSNDVLYMATLSKWDLQILSVPEEAYSELLAETFKDTVIPYACERINDYIKTSYNWKTVMVLHDKGIYNVTCSEGMLFPSREEIEKEIKKKPHPICGIPTENSF